MEIKVIFENENYLVINKPVGIVVNRAESVGGETMQDWIDNRDQGSEIRGQGAEGILFTKRSGICHRLDKETS